MSNNYNQQRSTSPNSPNYNQNNSQNKNTRPAITPQSLAYGSPSTNYRKQTPSRNFFQRIIDKLFKKNKPFKQ